MTTPQPAIAVIATPSTQGLPVSTLSQHAEKLAAQLTLPLVTIPLEELHTEYDFVLQVCPYQDTDYYIALRDLQNNTTPVFVNFSQGKLAHRRRFGGGRKQPLARAVGLKPGINPVIVDTTAGLARDAFVFACLGCRVILIERSLILAVLIEDGMRRAAQDAEIAALVRENMQIYQGEAKQIIRNVLNCEFDVAYVDPMYPARNKSALVKKEMRMLRALIGDDMDAGELLSAAHSCARQRVVVKRPRLASCLPGPAPDFKIESKSTRYDIYLSDNPRHP